MIISEIFYSLQGEGMLTGVPSVFIRTSGCNLRCKWCDTSYASWYPEGLEMSIKEIINSINKYQCDHIVLTGGEPMITKDIFKLAEIIYDSGKHLTIETAGSVAPGKIKCHLASISPKMSNSIPEENLSESWINRHKRDRLNIDYINQWIENYDYQLKFVIVDKKDIDEINDFVFKLGKNINPEKILLMPEGTTVESMNEKYDLITDACKKYGYRFCNRLQIELFGNKKGT